MYKKGKVFADSSHQGWFYGSFMPEGLQKDDRVEIKVAEYDASCSSPLHYQKTATKIDIIWEGEAIWVVDGEEIKVQKGDYIIIPPLTQAGIRKVISKKLIVQTIKFPSLPGDKVMV